MGRDNSSIVIDNLSDEAEDTVVIYFYFEFASRNEQSLVNMLGSLLRQLISELGGIPEEVARAFRKRRRGIEGKGPRISGILEMLRAATATKRIFICIDALDECAPEYRMEVLESLKQILQESPNTRLFMTGRPYVRSEVERKLDGAATFMSIQPVEEDILRYIRDRLENDTAPEIMSNTLEADVMRTVPEITSEMYVEMGARKGYPR